MQLLTWPKIALTAVVALGAGSGGALAQAGSTGGSVGVGEKTLSGPRSEPSSDSEEPKPRGREGQESGRSSRRSGAGAGNFDGTWSYIVVGTNCPGSSSGAITISGGSISARGVTGSVSSSGAYHAVAVGGRGLVSTATGRLSGNTGAAVHLDVPTAVWAAGPHRNSSEKRRRPLSSNRRLFSAALKSLFARS